MGILASNIPFKGEEVTGQFLLRELCLKGFHEALGAFEKCIGYFACEEEFVAKLLKGIDKA